MIPHPPIDDEILDDLRRRIKEDRRCLGALVPRLIARIDLEQRANARHTFTKEYEMQDTCEYCPRPAVYLIVRGGLDVNDEGDVLVRAFPRSVCEDHR
jgi:hypothetical protein